MRNIGATWRRLAVACTALSLGAGPAFGVLPDGVTHLEYIQGNGAAYLDTGWTLHPQEDVFEAVVEFITSNTRALWSTRNTGNKLSCTMFYFGTSYFRVDYAGVQTTISRNIGIDVGVPYTITVSNGTTIVSNGARVDVPAESSFTTAPGPLLLFAACQYDSGTMQNVGSYGDFRLRSFRIWRNGKLVREFLPVLTSDNVVTLADRVEGGVLKPLGTGSFSAGGTATPFSATVPVQLRRDGVRDARPALSVTDEETGETMLEGVDYVVDFERYGSESRGRAIVTPTIGSSHARETALEVGYDILSAPPSGYTRLEYVQGDGASYWVTDYLPQPTNDEITVDFAFTEQETVCLFCSRVKAGEKSWSFWFLYENSVIKRRLDYGGTTKGGDLLRPFPYGARNRLTVANKNAVTSCGDDITVSTDALTEAGDYLAILASYANGTENAGSFSKQRLYRFSVRRSGALIHDWVPVLNPQGVATLYDMVEGKELTPKGTGAFIAGPALGGVEVDPIPVQTLPTGGTCEPVPVVTQAGTGVRLVAGTDYTVTYTNNSQAGLAMLTVTGAGLYAGAFALTVPFNITLPPPSGVTRLDYIQGNGSAYLLTDWTINPQTDRVESDIELTDLSNGSIWCARSGPVLNTFTLFRLNDDTFRCDSGNNASDASQVQAKIGWAGLFPQGVKLPVVAHGSDFTVGDVRSRRVVAETFTESGGPLMMFASYSGDTSSSLGFQSRHRLYEFRLYRCGELVRHWVPVRTSGGVATLCELKTGKTMGPNGEFIAGPVRADFDVYVSDQAWDGERAVKPFVAATNRTTGAALVLGTDYTVAYTNNATEGWARAIVSGASGSAYAGQGAVADFRVIRELPEGYERLEYVEADGATALLTDYVAQPPSDTLTIDFELRDRNTGGGVFCARGAGQSNSWSFCWSASAFRFDCHTNMNNLAMNSIVMGDMRYTMKFAGNVAKPNCGDGATASVTVTEAGGPLVLFSYYDNPTSMNISGFSAVRMYSCTVVRSGELIHDWVPVRTPEGEVTMYDRVVGDTPVLLGTGKLIAGPTWALEGPAVVPAGTFLFVR